MSFPCWRIFGFLDSIHCEKPLSISLDVDGQMVYTVLITLFVGKVFNGKNKL